MKHVLPTFACTALLLAGCAAPRIENDVTTFHDEIMPAGESIRVMPADPANVNSLEFQTYANRISEELRKAGYTPVSEPDVVTDLIAEIDYSVAVSHSEINRSRTGVSVGVGYGFGRWYNPWNIGVSAPIFGRESRPYGIPIYQRSLELNIVEAEDSTQRLFEGRVVSDGSEGALNVVMPYLITAMFTDFPGESGTTKVVEIEAE
jgi:hypothetical protein